MDYFLSNVNRSVGENMRFVRQFNANPEAFISNSQTSQVAPSDPMAQLSPMLMLMLFQMMSQMMTRMGMGLPQESYPPVTLPPATGLPPQIAQNPAFAYLEQLFQAKAAESPEATSIEFTEADITLVRNAMAQGQFNINQLGQSLKFQLDQAPDVVMPAVKRVITDLMDSGELSVTPFLANDYLTKLSPERRTVLLEAVELAGLRMDSNRPNSRFIGFLLENLDKPEQPMTRAFLQKFLQDFYDVHGQTPTTPVGKILQQVLELGGVTVNAEKQLLFPN